VTRHRLPLPGSDLPTVDEYAGRLRRAGWSCGDFATAGGWTVSGTSGTNGENVLLVTAPAHPLAWRRAVEAARAVGMLWGEGGTPGHN
jgi:hypothetical protein